VIDAYGVNVTVIVAHNGQGKFITWALSFISDLTYPTQEETPLDRELQATELARIMSATYPDPLIFLGYVVTDPHAKRREYLHPPTTVTTKSSLFVVTNVCCPAAPYEIIVTDGCVHDIDKDDMDRWCEYIFLVDFIGQRPTPASLAARS